MERLQLELRMRADEDGLWLEDGGERISLPSSFWSALAYALREAGQPELARRLERVIEEARAKRARAEAKFRCMDPVYSPEEARRCHELLDEDLVSPSR